MTLATTSATRIDFVFLRNSPSSVNSFTVTNSNLVVEAEMLDEIAMFAKSPAKIPKKTAMVPTLIIFHSRGTGTQRPNDFQHASEVAWHDYRESAAEGWSHHRYGSLVLIQTISIIAIRGLVLHSCGTGIATASPKFGHVRAFNVPNRDRLGRDRSARFTGGDAFSALQVADVADDGIDLSGFNVRDWGHVPKVPVVRGYAFVHGVVKGEVGVMSDFV